MANYGIHFMIEVKFPNGRIQSQYITAQFSCDDKDWSSEAKAVYEAMLQVVERDAKLNRQTICKVHPPNIIKLGEQE
jgi:hypothetical protein